MDDSRIVSKKESKTEIKDCRVSEVISAKLYECRTEKDNCGFQFFFRNYIYCKHPLKHEIAVDQNKR